MQPSGEWISNAARARHLHVACSAHHLFQQGETLVNKCRGPPGGLRNCTIVRGKIVGSDRLTRVEHVFHVTFGVIFQNGIDLCASETHILPGS